jgi:hypothetical protein
MVQQNYFGRILKMDFLPENKKSPGYGLGFNA